MSQQHHPDLKKELASIGKIDDKVGGEAQRDHHDVQTENGVRRKVVGRLIKKVTLSYNKTGQAAITKELMDIVGGAEALK